MSALLTYGVFALLVGIGLGHATVAIVKLHKTLEAETGDMPVWADRIALVGAWVSGLLLSAIGGAVVGHEYPELTRNAGAVVGLVGGFASPHVYGDVRRLFVRAIRSKVESAE